MKKLICFCILLILLFNISFAQQTKIVSSYGLINQDVGFEQIKADRMKVKADRAKEHITLLNVRYTFQKRHLRMFLCQEENQYLQA